MPTVPARLPDHCRPRGPAQPLARVEEAARDLVERMEADPSFQLVSGEWAVRLFSALGGLPRTAQHGVKNRVAYRVAVCRLVDAGLFSVVTSTDDPPAVPPDDVTAALEGLRPKPEPELLLLSTPQLRARWDSGAPLLVQERCAAESPPTPSPEPTETDPRPEWDGQTRTLCYRGTTLKRYSHSARVQTAILAAFQNAGWPPSINTPDSVRGDQLGSAVKNLNDAVGGRGIRFRRRGTGSLVGWEPIV